MRFASLLLAALAGCSGCSKSANQETASGESTTKTAPLSPDHATAKTVPVDNGAKPPAGNDARFRLQPEEGKLAIEAPADAKANAETTAKITVTASSLYKVNTEFPVKLTLESPTGVTLAKAELKAGGHDKAKGDADAFDEHELVFAVKLTPASPGSYTINGTFKFAVCDKAGSTCLAKKEPIAIQVAAK